MATPMLNPNSDSGYDDLTPYLMDLARTMEAEKARTGSSHVGTPTKDTRVDLESPDAARVPANPGKPVLQNPIRGQVRFTLAVSGSVDPVSLGALLILIGMLVAMIAV
jgi:hypothetical protein